MGLNHTFDLIPNTTETRFFWMYREEKNSFIDSVIIHDDMIQHIYDSLDWIPSKNPGKKGTPNSRGINYHGVTLFDKQSSELLIGIFSSWRDLFKNAPLTFELTEKFTFSAGDDQVNTYEKLVFNRDDIINQFEKMISMSEHLAEGEFYLYHCGI